MKTLIFDCEIKHGVVSDNNPPQVGFKYAEGWQDFLGMGISVICAYDVDAAQYRVFCDDNRDAFTAHLGAGYRLTGFNNYRFDDPLLEAHGIEIPLAQSLDLASLIWRAAGVPRGEHPKGLGLDACCVANGLPGKTGNGATAPEDWQAGRVGRVIDYCLGDVRSTLALYRYLCANGGLTDPRDPSRWICVTVPR